MNDELATLQLLHAKGLGPSTLRRLFSYLLETGESPSELLYLDPDELYRRYGLNPQVAEEFKNAADKAEEVFQQLQEHDVRIITSQSSAYPQSLKDVLREEAPPVLFAMGNMDILSNPSVGFCGSRKATNRGLQIANDCASILAQHGVNIVSGYASGVDMATHRGALDAGGVSTFVLAEGILRFSSKRGIGELLNESNSLILSEFPPLLTWQVHNAMQRNRTICGLSNAMILVEAGMKGGTFSAGEDTLRLGQPLFVVDFGDRGAGVEGNAHFISRGAYPLRGDRSSRPNLHGVFALLGAGGNRQPIQQTLF